MDDIKDLHDWNENKGNGFHLKIAKPYSELTDIDVRVLLEKLVERQNFSMDKILSLDKKQKETYVILENIMNKLNKAERTNDALVKLANSMAAQMDQQGKIIQDLMKK